MISKASIATMASNSVHKILYEDPHVKDVYELPFKVTVENKLRSFQYKLVHNIIPTNLSL